MTIILRFRFPLWIFLFLLFSSVSESKAQDIGFAFLIESNDEQASVYKEALLKADLEKFRLKDSRRQLRFEDGVEFELLSALELIERGSLMDPGDYQALIELDSAVEYVFKTNNDGNLAVRSVIGRGSKLSKIDVASPSSEDRKVIGQREFDQMKPEKQQHIINNPSLFIVK